MPDPSIPGDPLGTDFEDESGSSPGDPLGTDFPPSTVPAVGPRQTDKTVVTGKLFFKIKLSDGKNTLIFEASSPLSENRAANYDGYNIVHLPTAIWAYRNTTSRHFTITGKLISRNEEEADVNSANLSMVRAWILPGFGKTGSTPPLLYLWAYGHEAITKLPVILTNYDWLFPEDVDYIFSADEPMPVISTLTLNLEEAYSPQQVTEGAWRIKIKKNEVLSLDGNEKPTGDALKTGQGGPAFENSSPFSNSPEISESTKNFNNQFLNGPSNDPQIRDTGIPSTTPPSFSNPGTDPFGRKIPTVRPVTNPNLLPFG